MPVIGPKLNRKDVVKINITIDANLFRDCMKAVSGLVDEVNFKVTKEEMALTAMDAANIAMVDFHLPNSSAIEWNVEEDGEEMALRLKDLNAVLRRVAKDDILKLESKDNQVHMHISGYKAFVIPMLELEDKGQRLPVLQHQVNINLPLARLADAIEDCSIAGESIGFDANEERLLVDAKGDLTKAAVTLKGEDIQLEVETPGVARYALSYLNKIVMKISDKVQLSIGTDYPLKLAYKAEKFKISFILAPRVETE